MNFIRPGEDEMSVVFGTERERVFIPTVKNTDIREVYTESLMNGSFEVL